MIASLLLLAGSAAFGQSAGRVHGTVTDAVTGAPLAAVVGIVSPVPLRNARTDSVGRFSFIDVPAGSVTIGASAFGYASERITVVVSPGQDIEVRIRLRIAARELETVRTTATISAEQAQAAGPAGGSITSLSVRDLRTIPALGETDVLRAAALLPGISARNDFWAGFNVRGGESDQTQVRLDGLSIFSPFHLGGLFSTFIPDAVSEVDARVGALPSSVGGRLSGVMDVTSGEESRAGVHGALDVSAISTALKLGGATPKSAGSWNLAVRRTYADELAKVVIGPDAFPYHFQDAQLHASLALRGGGALRFTGYTGLDLLQPTTDSGSAVLGGSGNAFRFDWGNKLAGLIYEQPLGVLGALSQRVSWSQFSTAYDEKATTTGLANHIADFHIAGDLTRRLGGTMATPLHTLALGYELSNLDVRYHEHISASSASDFSGNLVIDDTLITQKSKAQSLYAEELFQPGKRLSVRAGVRAERVPSADWTGVSPRLSAKYRASDRVAFTLAGGRYSQWVHAVRNEDLPVRIVDIWFASDSDVPVSTSTEFVGGTELWLTRSDFLRVEAYDKHFADLIEPASTIDPRLRPSELKTFGGESHGVDVLLRHLATDHLSGWISYSYGKSIREANGEVYAPAHDRRHDLNVVASYRKSERYSFGARLGIASGTPYTGWAGSYSRWSWDPVSRRWRVPNGTSGARDEQVRTARNTERYPTYNRLDLSAHRNGHFRGAEVDAFVNLVNATNARNVLIYTFDTSVNPPAVRGYSQLPFLPTIGMRLAF
ncbi:MAG: TonB-dependent receptor plug [Gemmatimonadetes bacterium]|nr:TonB-dependent receptor plug [Gemmatimonadota bacterium]